MHSYLKLEYIPYQLETRVVKGLLVVGRVFFYKFLHENSNWALLSLCCNSERKSWLADVARVSPSFLHWWHWRRTAKRRIIGRTTMTSTTTTRGATTTTRTATKSSTGAPQPKESVTSCSDLCNSTAVRFLAVYHHRRTPHCNPLHCLQVALLQ